MKKILIIDDEKAFCELIEAALTATGLYKVVSTTDGNLGVKVARDEQPDLILLDIIMPGIDGFKVAKKLKDNKKTSAIPVIMLTSLDDAYHEGYIVKPVEMPILIKRLEEALK